MTVRQQVIHQIAGHILAMRCRHPVRVAIDGIDAAGKTRLADELVLPLQSQGRPVIRASIDGFQRPRRERYRRGSLSAEGYYEDAFDYPQIRAALLEPLGSGGNRRYRREIFDYRQDQPIDSPEETAPDDAILLVDGVFLLRPELLDAWDYRIFVQVDFDEGLRRGIERDAATPEMIADITQRYQTRYYPAQRHYLQTVRPQQVAQLVVGNQDVDSPTLSAPN
jgi:uridine kinase